MKRFLTLFVMDARMVLRSRQAIGWTVAFPVLMMLFWGYIGRGAMVQATFGSVTTISFAGFFMGGMIVLTTLSQGIQGYAPVMVSLREQGILRRVRCTPLPTWMFLVSRLLVEVVSTLIGCLAIIIVAMALFGVRLSWRTVPAALGLMLLSIALFTSFGQLIAALARKQETARAMAQVLAFPLMFVGGLFLQPDLFPKPLATVAQWTPAAVVGDLLRPALIQGNFGTRPAPNLLVLVGYLAAALAISTRFFKWDEV